MNKAGGMEHSVIQCEEAMMLTMLLSVCVCGGGGG